MKILCITLELQTYRCIVNGTCNEDQWEKSFDDFVYIVNKITLKLTVVCVNEIGASRKTKSKKKNITDDLIKIEVLTLHS